MSSWSGRFLSLCGASLLVFASTAAFAKDVSIAAISGYFAQGFGVWAEGPIDTADAVGPALRRALRVVKDEGRPALVDVITRP